MALDTPTKRRSMTAIPGVTTFPAGDGTIDSNNRLHLLDVFAAITPAEESFFFWRQDADESQAWRAGSAAAAPFVAGRKAPGESWVPVPDHKENG